MNSHLATFLRRFFVSDIRAPSDIGPHIVRSTLTVCVFVVLIALVEAHLTDQRYLATVVIGVTCVVMIMPPINYLHARVHVRNHNLRQRLRASIRKARTARREMEARNAELEDARELLSDMANSDPLTGLCNRRHFDIVLQSRFDSGEPFGVLAIDLDAFKPVNDIYGHEAGDTVLRGVATRLKAVMSWRDGAIARLGGDEFIVLVNDIDEGELADLAEEIKASLAQPHDYREHMLNVSASIGWCMGELDFDLPSEIVAAADQALLRDKEANVKNALNEPGQTSVVRGPFGRARGRWASFG